MIIDFKIGGKTYSTPETLSIADHYEIKKESILSETPEFWIVSYLSGCPEETLRRMSTKDWEELWELVEVWLYKNSTPDPETGLSPILKIDGQEYGRVDFEKMTIGEFADLDLIMTKDFENRLHEFMAILYRPITKRKGKDYYEIAEHESGEVFRQRSELFKRCPLLIFKKTQAFFLLSKWQSSKTIDPYSESPEKIKEMMEKLDEHLRSLLPLLGIPFSPDWLTMTSSNWISLRSSQSEKLSIGSLIKRVSRIFRKPKSHIYN